MLWGDMDTRSGRLGRFGRGVDGFRAVALDRRDVKGVCRMFRQVWCFVLRQLQHTVM